MKTRSLTLASLVALTGSLAIGAPAAFADAPAPDNIEKVNDLLVDFQATDTVVTKGTDGSTTTRKFYTGLGGQKFTVKVGDGAAQELTYNAAGQAIVTDWLPGGQSATSCIGTNEVTITPGAMMQAVTGNASPVTLCQAGGDWVVKGTRTANTATATTNPDASIKMNPNNPDVLTFDFDWSRNAGAEKVDRMPFTVEVRDAKTKEIIPGAKYSFSHLTKTSWFTLDADGTRGNGGTSPLGIMEGTASNGGAKTAVKADDLGGPTIAPGGDEMWLTVQAKQTPEGYQPLPQGASMTLNEVRSGYAVESKAETGFGFDPASQTAVIYLEPVAATETPAPSDTDTPEPSDTESPAPSETDTPAPSDTETPAPSDTESPEPSDTDTPAPSDSESPSPSDTETPAPSDTDTPEPSDTESPAPSDSESPAPSDSESPSPSETDTPAPSDTESPAPSDTSTTGTVTPPADNESPAPSDDATSETPAPSDSETSSESAPSDSDSESPAPSATSTDSSAPSATSTDAPAAPNEDTKANGPKVQTDGSAHQRTQGIVAAALAMLGLGGLGAAGVLRSRRQD